MTQYAIKVRVRPARVMVLVGAGQAEPAINLAFEFLSRVWGGKYCPIHVVPSAAATAEDRQCIGIHRPEFVYGVGIDPDVWANEVRSACQARGYGDLKPEFVRSLDERTVESLITNRPVILGTLDELAGANPRPILSVTASAPGLSTCSNALFGVFDVKVTPEVLPHSARNVGSITELISLLVEKHTQGALSWLDLVSRGLQLDNLLSVGPPPSVVFCGGTTDLSLFWNLRSQVALGVRDRVIALPAGALDDPSCIDAIAAWLRLIENAANYCELLSVSVDRRRLVEYSAKLRRRLRGSQVAHIDVGDRPQPSPVLSYDVERVQTIEYAANRISWSPLRPSIENHLRSSERWLVDLLEDTNTGRSPFDLVAPRRAVSVDVLNAPSPPRLSLARVPKLAIGLDSVNVWCSLENHVDAFTLPTPEELIEEILREGRFEPTSDEKRMVYAPVLNLFGGLGPAAFAFTGKPRDVLVALEGGPKTFNEIAGKAKIGDGKLQSSDRTGRLMQWLKNASPATKRVARKRWEAQGSSDPQAASEIHSLLDLWVARGVIQRRWRLPRCDHCGQISWVEAIDLARSTICPSCGMRIPLAAQVELGYCLHPIAAHAIKEGLVPVALTARLLQELTRNGFQWLPGVKGTFNSKPTDVDIAALCDGHLVLAECKSMAVDANTKTWKAIFQKFGDLIELGKAVKADLVVLASLAVSYPKALMDTAKRGASPVKLMFLTRDELRSGTRFIEDKPGETREMAISDLFRRPTRRKRKRRGPRRLSF